MTRGRHRDRLLAEGLTLLARQGFAATGVQDIVDAGGVPKGSFYNYFRSKDAFAAEVLERYGQGACCELEQVLTSASGTPLGQLRQVLTAMADRATSDDFAGGCVAGRLAQELAGERPEFRAPLARVFGGMRELFARQLERAKESSEIDATSDPEALADFLLSTWQGAMLRAKALGDRRPLDVAIELLFDRVLARRSSETAGVPAPGGSRKGRRSGRSG